ncbi:hypothetical protein F4859DRAFT_464163 [Xylaria cf. heliscus]|nr:hypothetical protein F4859DRAFT_464163 [Xylaria cf. heliscus]
MPTDGTTKAATRLPRRPSSRDNFSYPRLSRHESSESRSSDGSIPGMTDASDSDISCDDDGIYNTSAGELWDSFWPDSTPSSIFPQSQEDDPVLLQPGQHEDSLKVNPIKRRQPSDADGDAVRITTQDYNPEADKLTTTPSHTFRSPLSQSSPKKSTVTYSVYPKIPVISVQRHPHPPRTSSLSFAPPSPPQGPLFLRGSRSSAALKSSQSSQTIHPLFIPPSLASSSKAVSIRQRPSTTAKTAVSVPVSPAYPPPPTPKTLRPSTSAFSLRDKARMHNINKGSVSHNEKAPPVSLLPSPLPEPLSTRPHVERFVSVFEFDSDSETEADVDEGNSFARRIARGLHKKTGSDKRGVAQRKVVTAGPTSLDADSSSRDLREKPRNGGSLSRKRGGSLGRIFGLMGR